MDALKGIAAMGCDSCISRRSFIERSALAAAAIALAACDVSDATSPSLSGALDVKVSDYPALANTGGVALVSSGQARLVIVRTGASSFAALSRVCPHQGELVNPSSTGFLCPGHGARFSTTGTWTGGQRTSSLHAYSTSWNAATGILTVTN